MASQQLEVKGSLSLLPLALESVLGAETQLVPQPDIERPATLYAKPLASSPWWSSFRNQSPGPPRTPNSDLLGLRQRLQEVF